MNEEITISLLFENCDYSEPTRDQIRERLSEMLINDTFTYKRKSITQPLDIHNELVSGVISAVNEEPISHTLETFKDIDDIVTESDKRKHLGRPSTEQGGNRIKSSYNTDRDPFNEE